jgi:miniconductance mechanosensitive channel
MFDLFFDWFLRAGAGEQAATTLAHIAGATIALTFSIFIYIVVKRYLFNTISRYVKETGTTRDDYLVDNKVFSRLALIVPAVVFYLLIPTIFTGNQELIDGARQIMAIYAVIIGVIVAEAVLDTILDIYHTFDASRSVPLKGLVQAIKILIFLLAGLLIISLSLDRSPVYILGGVGAFTAVLMLIFQDSILGLVAGVQLSTNQMLARGDFIEMPGYDADGIVTDVALTTVKVQNADMSITTIPTYALIKESFRNWRGLDVAAGRRLKRNINIDITTIRICDEQMLRRYAEIPYVEEYLQLETAACTGDADAEADLALLAKRRAVTNVSAFRAYVERFLAHHTDLNHDMTLLVRPLEPTASGLPIQIYVFIKEKSWIPYERIQADIFDHIMAIVQDFDLKIFQNPSGHDMRAFVAHGG